MRLRILVDIDVPDELDEQDVLDRVTAAVADALDADDDIILIDTSME